jgi:hypothetical protein
MYRVFTPRKCRVVGVGRYQATMSPSLRPSQSQSSSTIPLSLVQVVSRCGPQRSSGEQGSRSCLLAYSFIQRLHKHHRHPQPLGASPPTVTPLVAPVDVSPIPSGRPGKSFVLRISPDILSRMKQLTAKESTAASRIVTTGRSVQGLCLWAILMEELAGLPDNPVSSCPTS